MKIFKNILSYFNKSDTKSLDINDGNAVIFSLNSSLNNEPHIKIKIDDTSEDGCKKFTEMLFDINTGLYHESVLRLLMKMSEEDSEIKKFVETAIIYWGFLLKEKRQNFTSNINWTQKPLIMPTDFNKHAK